MRNELLRKIGKQSGTKLGFITFKHLQVKVALVNKNDLPSSILCVNCIANSLVYTCLGCDFKFSPRYRNYLVVCGFLFCQKRTSKAVSKQCKRNEENACRKDEDHMEKVRTYHALIKFHTPYFKN